MSTLCPPAPYILTCPACSGVVQDGKCSRCLRPVNDLRIRARRLFRAMAGPDCTCGLPDCDECTSPTACFCGDCGEPCGMAMDASGFVVSRCYGEQVYRDRALTVRWEDHDALHEMQGEPEVMALDADYRKTKRERP